MDDLKKPYRQVHQVITAQSVIDITAPFGHEQNQEADGVWPLEGDRVKHLMRRASRLQGSHSAAQLGIGSRKLLSQRGIPAVRGVKRCSSFRKDQDACQRE